MISLNPAIQPYKNKNNTPKAAKPLAFKGHTLSYFGPKPSKKLETPNLELYGEVNLDELKKFLKDVKKLGSLIIHKGATFTEESFKFPKITNSVIYSEKEVSGPTKNLNAKKGDIFIGKKPVNDIGRTAMPMTKGQAPSEL